MATMMIVAFILLEILALYTAYAVGLTCGVIGGYKHTSHARDVHMHDLGNVHSLIVRDENPNAAVAYIHQALAKVQCNPAIDQVVPERL